MLDYRENFRKRGEKIKRIQNMRQIIELGDFELATKMIQEFLVEFGDDIEVLYHYGKLLRKLGKIEESISTFKYILEIQKREQVNGFLDCTKKELFKVYYINNFYDEAYKIFPQIKHSFSQDMGEKSETVEAELIEKILEVKLGLYEDDVMKDNLVIQKLLCYDEAYAIEHIKRHQHAEEKYVHSIFSEIDIVELHKMVQTILPESQKRQQLSVHDAYLFYFPGIGNDAEQLMVVTNKGTYEVITMYPLDENLKGIINYNLYDTYLEQQTAKVKRISQIDKFNRRYNKNR